MAEIYLAEAANIHGFRKKVVIKRMLPQYVSEQTYVDMFLDEARLVARLNHPSVVQVFDIGEDDEGVFFTMEYVEGRDLSEILGTCYRANRLLTFSEVLAIAIPAAEGLHHAHEARDDHGEFINLIHRDVSPSNIIVTNAGRVKLLDFGVAKSKSQSRETTGVSLKGKFGYMAPEQCEGLVIDRRCDIYAFGVVLWELFTGKRLHAGGNEPAVLVKIMTVDPPAPSTIRPDIPPELDGIVLKALKRNRDERYSTLQELLEAIDSFMTSSGTVVSSRTLSSMLRDVFADERPTMAVAAQQLSTPESAQAEVLVTRPPPGDPASKAPSSPGSNAGSAPGSHPGSDGSHDAGGSAEIRSRAMSHITGSQPLIGTPGNYESVNSTGPMRAVGPPTPNHGYARLAPGSQFEQSSEIVVPMKSRRGVFAAIGGTVVVLTLGLILVSSGSSDSSGDKENDSTTNEGAVVDDEGSSVETTPVEDTRTDEQIAADKLAAAQELADKLAAEKEAAAQAAADKLAAEKEAAAQAAADKLAAENKLAADKKEAAAQEAALQAAALQAASDKKAADKLAAAQAAADKKAAAKLAADKRAADRKAAAEKRAADRKAAAAKKDRKNPKDRKKPKWDPNSPFAPQ